MDKKYWKKYYTSNSAPEDQSPFAKFVMENYIKSNDTLFELGCGNGRDSIFFASKDVVVTAIDQCENEIKILKEKNNKINFLCGDFTDLDEIDPVDHIYSRFTLHSINEEQENKVTKWTYKNLKENGYFFIEARGKKNELYKLGEKVEGEKDSYIYENHYRRFIDIEELKNKLISEGFEIIYSEEKKGFAPFNNTDYKFIRIIANKK